MSTIVNIEPLFLRYPFPPSIRYEYSAGVVENMDAALVRVTCDNGQTGLGEITHGQFCYEPIVGLIQSQFGAVAPPTRPSGLMRTFCVALTRWFSNRIGCAWKPIPRSYE